MPEGRTDDRMRPARLRLPYGLLSMQVRGVHPPDRLHVSVGGPEEVTLVQAIQALARPAIRRRRSVVAITGFATRARPGPIGKVVSDIPSVAHRVREP